MALLKSLAFCALAVVAVSCKTSTAESDSTAKSVVGSSVPSSGGSLSISDVIKAISRNEQKYTSYNASSAVQDCRDLGAKANPPWSQTMQDYYCSFPGVNPDIRACFSLSAASCVQQRPLDYSDCYRLAYHNCSSGGGPLAYIANNEDHPDDNEIFTRVMIDRAF